MSDTQTDPAPSDDFAEELWTGAKAIIRTVAPTVASALGGPLAGMAVSALSDALLGKPDATHAEVLEAVKGMTPDDLAKLKSMDYEFKAKMAQMSVDVLALEFKDNDSARNRQVQTKDHTPNILAYILTAGFFGMLLLFAFRAIPNENATILAGFTGSLGTVWLLAMHFFYGSTRSSDAQTGMIFNSTQNK